jgi:hypothetical protein
VSAYALGTLKPERPKVEPIRQPTLFQMEKLEKAADLMGKLQVERPYDQQPGLLLGTSAFTAAGWPRQKGGTAGSRLHLIVVRLQLSGYLPCLRFHLCPSLLGGSRNPCSTGSGQNSFLDSSHFFASRTSQSLCCGSHTIQLVLQLA